MNDRRRTGVNHVVVTDDNGGTMKIVTATAKTGQLVIGFLLGLAALFGVIMGGVKWGANIQIEDQVEEMAADEHSGLHREMVDIAEIEAETVAGAVQDDLDIFEMEQKKQGETIIRMEERQIGFEKKMDDDKRDIINEIRRNRDGSG